MDLLVDLLALLECNHGSVSVIFSQLVGGTDYVKKTGALIQN